MRDSWWEVRNVQSQRFLYCSLHQSHCHNARMRERVYLHQVRIHRVAERATVEEIINSCDNSWPWDVHCVNQSTNMHWIQLRVLYDGCFSVCSRPSLYSLLHHALSAETDLALTVKACAVARVLCDTTDRVTDNNDIA